MSSNSFLTRLSSRARIFILVLGLTFVGGVLAQSSLIGARAANAPQASNLSAIEQQRRGAKPAPTPTPSPKPDATPSPSPDDLQPTDTPEPTPSLRS